MKITIELPDTTKLVFVNHAYVDNGVLMMAVKQLDGDGIEEAKAEYLSLVEKEDDLK